MTNSTHTLALALCSSYFIYCFVTIIIITVIIIVQVAYIIHKIIWIYEEAESKSLTILLHSDDFFKNNVVYILSGLL